MKVVHLSKRGKLFILISFLILIISILALYLILRPKILFNSNHPTVEINETFDALSNVKKVRGGSTDDVTCDLSNVDYTKLGKYTITYSFGKHQYDLKLEVIDSTPPTFDTKELEIDAKMPLTPDMFVENIQDATATSVEFKEKYPFDTEGDFTITLIVKDEGGNETSQDVLVHVLPEDVTPPEIQEVSDITLMLDAQFDPLSDISVSDNQDPAPQISCDTSKLNLNKIGDYTITYTAVDRSGNQSSYTRTIHIIERKTIGHNYASETKTVYLTFDDGPSENTGKILDILDRYQVKATFFVTGNGQKYNHHIKEAHDKGHTIGLHTYTHQYSEVYSSVNAYFDDLDKISDMVEEITGERSHYIRFPGGSSNTVSKKYCKGIMTELSKEVIERGYQYYDWNVSSNDANGNTMPTQTIIEGATSGKSDNLVILFHDSPSKTTTVEALPTIIEYYQNQGYTFAPIDDSTYTSHHGINN